jgi:hypothetical protein
VGRSDGKRQLGRLGVDVEIILKLILMKRFLRYGLHCSGSG